MSFPSSPANNTTALVNGINYIYDTTYSAWRRVPGAAVETMDSVARNNANTALLNVGASSSYANAAYIRANNSLNVHTGGSITGDTTITGNVSVTGTYSTFTTPTFRTSDHIIDLGYGTTGAPASDAGFRILRGDENPVQIRWVEADDRWEYTNDGATYIKIGSESDGIYANAAFSKANTAYGWGDHTAASYATITYVNSEIANLVNSSPTTLDTLNELAAALGNDANFSTTISTMVGVAGSYSNSAYLQANASYISQNTTGVYTNTAFQYANSAASYANGAFAAANNATDTWVRNAANSSSSYSNSAFQYANSAASYANAAFEAANNATDTWVRNAANSSSSYSNSAYIHANAAFERANTGGAGGGLIYTASSTTPASANVGDQWYSTTEDILYEYLSNGSSNVWVDITSSAITTNNTAPVSAGTNNVRSIINSYVFGY